MLVNWKVFLYIIFFIIFFFSSVSYDYVKLLCTFSFFIYVQLWAILLLIYTIFRDYVSFNLDFNILYVRFLVKHINIIYVSIYLMQWISFMFKYFEQPSNVNVNGFIINLLFL